MEKITMGIGHKISVCCLLASVLALSACNTTAEPEETEIITTVTVQEPVTTYGNLDNLAPVTVPTSSETTTTTTTFQSNEPIVTSLTAPGRVYDGFSTASADNIKFFVKKTDRGYLLFTNNGVDMPSASYVENGIEILDAIDFGQTGLIIGLGSLTFKSGGIAGVRMVPSIVSIDAFSQSDIIGLVLEFELQKFDIDTTYDNDTRGLWLYTGCGSPCIITSLTYNGYALITDSYVGYYDTLKDVADVLKMGLPEPIPVVSGTLAPGQDINSVNSAVLEAMLPDDFTGYVTSAPTEDTETTGITESLDTTVSASSFDPFGF